MKQCHRFLLTACAVVAGIGWTSSPAAADVTSQIFCQQNLNPSSGYCNSATHDDIGLVLANATGGGWSCARIFFPTIGVSSAYYCNGPGSTYGGTVCAIHNTIPGYGRIKSDESHNGAVHYYTGTAFWGGGHC